MSVDGDKPAGPGAAVPAAQAPIVPQSSGLDAAVAALAGGGVVAFPTDTLYGIGCALGRQRAIERILAMRAIDRARRPLTFLLPDISELARYAEVSEAGRRILERIFPGPFCVELGATAAVPDPYVAGPRRAIGVRVPDHPFCEQMLWRLGIPVLTATAKTPDGRLLATAEEIRAAYGADLDLIVDGGPRPLDGAPSTVIRLVGGEAMVLRRGLGDPALLPT